MRMKGEKEAQGGGRIWQEGIPLLKEEGWLRHQENAAKPPLKGADGVVIRDECSRTDHPVRASKRRLRGIFLMARPPLLSQEGNTLCPRQTSK